MIQMHFESPIRELKYSAFKTTLSDSPFARKIIGFKNEFALRLGSSFTGSRTFRHLFTLSYWKGVV